MSRPRKKITVKPSRITNIALVTVFVSFVSVFFLLICFLPKHEGELSPNERRMLAKAPNFTLDNILGGGFSSEVDTWLEDHFPFRTFFVTVYSYLNRWTGRNATEDVILGKNGRLFSAPTEVDEELTIKNGRTVSDFIEANGLSSHTVLVPSSGYMLEDELPSPHFEYEDDRIISLFEDSSGLSDHSAHIDAGTALRSHGSVDELYYRTDHHLTMEGTYALYEAVAHELGFEPVPESEFSKTDYDFYGTSYGGSGLSFVKPDTLQTWTLPTDGDIKVTTIDGERVLEHSGMLDPACLEEGVVDRYAAYLYSNHGYTSVVNPNVKDGTLLVLKDSFGNALVPFLTSHYHEIIMIDVRYFSSSMELPSETVARLGIKDMLIIYDTDSAATLRELAWLR